MQLDSKTVVLSDHLRAVTANWRIYDFFKTQRYNFRDLVTNEVGGDLLPETPLEKEEVESIL